AAVRQKVGQGAVIGAILRGREVRRRRVLVEVDVRIVKRPGETSTDGPDSTLTGRIREAETRSPIVLAGLRRSESDDARDVRDGVVRLVARTHRDRDVLVAHPEIEGQVVGNPEIVVEVSRALEEAIGDVRGAGVAFA